MKAPILAAVQTKIAALKTDYPGLGVEDRGTEFHITIPDALRVGHEAHFAQVTTNFLKYLRDRNSLPVWERSNMLAKYYVTTKGTEMSRNSPSGPAPRIAPQ
jgi:hypothetical protein